MKRNWPAARHRATALAAGLLWLAGCDTAAPAANPRPAAAAATAAQTATAEPAALLAAIDRAYPQVEQLLAKERTGDVVPITAARGEQARARRDLMAIKDNLTGLSRAGLPTFALLHSIGDDGHLWAWLIRPDGGIVAGRSPRPYQGLGALPDGLGVTRYALTRGPQPKGQLRAALDAETGDDDRGTPAVLAQRQATLRDSGADLLPGPIATALAAARGRLLVLPVRDTGTAPYAALPLGGDVAARRWSFVVMQDVASLASDTPWFDMMGVKLARAVVVGDPDDMRDVRYDFPPLPGARKEALAIADQLGVPAQSVLIGHAASRANVVRAINRMKGGGLVYFATHAVADPRTPLTRGFLVLDRTNLFAGELRQTRFRGWNRRQPLVVMSACQTGLGRVYDGGIYGIARTFTDAGAGQVVASLWNVSDKATLRLMTHFADGLKHGLPPETAMQQAQLALLKLYPDNPKLWASFTIIGKPALAATG